MALAVHIAILLSLVLIEPAWPRSLVLAIGWLISASAGFWLSPGKRGLGLLVIAASALFASRTLLYVLFTIACAGGNCI